MSGKDVEIVRQVYQRLNRGDVECVVELCDDDFLMDMSDSVVALLHCHWQSREGGPGVEWRVAWLWKLRRGKPVSLRFYRHRAQALEAAGLRE